MSPEIATQAVFWGATFLTLLLILRRPYLSVSLGKRHIRVQTYFMGALLGPVMIMGFGFLSYSDVSRSISGSDAMQPGGVLALFLAMVFMSIFLDITGFFEMCARYALRYARADGTRLFFAVTLTVSLLTVFTSNDIVILTFTPFIYYFTRNAGLDPRPYLGLRMWWVAVMCSLSLLLLLSARDSYAALLRRQVASLRGGSVSRTMIGSNLGANLTPLGALAGIMWMGILREKDCRLSFLQFIGYGLIITPATLAAALITLALEIHLMG